LAARACARQILRDMGDDSAGLREAQLILTAVCLHLHGQVGGRLNGHVLLAGLERLTGRRQGAADLAQSPLQFVRYVAAEVSEAEPGSLAMAIDLAIRAVQIVAT
jgi:hypothetical protein